MSTNDRENWIATVRFSIIPSRADSLHRTIPLVRLNCSVSNLILFRVKRHCRHREITTMPKDAAGNFRPNHQLARQADRAAEGRKSQPTKQTSKPDAAPPPDNQDSGGGGSELHDNGDGTYTTTCDGQTTQHPTLGSALVAMAAHHEPEGTHVHAHHDGPPEGEPVAADGALFGRRRIAIERSRIAGRSWPARGIRHERRRRNAVRQ